MIPHGKWSHRMILTSLWWFSSILLEICYLEAIFQCFPYHPIRSIVTLWNQFPCGINFPLSNQNTFCPVESISMWNQKWRSTHPKMLSSNQNHSFMRSLEESPLPWGLVFCGTQVGNRTFWAVLRKRRNKIEFSFDWFGFQTQYKRKRDIVQHWSVDFHLIGGLIDSYLCATKEWLIWVSKHEATCIWNKKPHKGVDAQRAYPIPQQNRNQRRLFDKSVRMGNTQTRSHISRKSSANLQDIEGYCRILSEIFWWFFSEMFHVVALTSQKMPNYTSTAVNMWEKIWKILDYNANALL